MLGRKREREKRLEQCIYYSFSNLNCKLSSKSVRGRSRNPGSSISIASGWISGKWVRIVSIKRSNKTWANNKLLLPGWRWCIFGWFFYIPDNRWRSNVNRQTHSLQDCRQQPRSAGSKDQLLLLHAPVQFVARLLRISLHLLLFCSKDRLGQRSAFPTVLHSTAAEWSE